MNRASKLASSTYTETNSDNEEALAEAILNMQ
jgi:hypothetical protein